MPPEPPDLPSDGYALALEEARRALDEQERTVAQLSTRAGILISAAAVVTSVLGAPVLAGRSLNPAAWVAMAAFTALTAAVLGVLRPRREWEFALHPAFVIGDYLETPAPERLSMRELRRELALNMGASVTRNQRELDAMMTTLNIASVSLAIEMLCWVVSITIAR